MEIRFEGTGKEWVVTGVLHEELLTCQVLWFLLQSDQDSTIYILDVTYGLESVCHLICIFYSFIFQT